MNIHFLIMAIYVVCIVLVWLLLMYNSESFANNDKAQHILNWFKTTKDMSYQQYKRDLDGLSDIVEYDIILNAYKKNNGILVEDVSSLL